MFSSEQALLASPWNSKHVLFKITDPKAMSDNSDDLILNNVKVSHLKAKLPGNPNKR